MAGRDAEEDSEAREWSVRIGEGPVGASRVVDRRRCIRYFGEDPPVTDETTTPRDWRTVPPNLRVMVVEP